MQTCFSNLHSQYLKHSPSQSLDSFFKFIFISELNFDFSVVMIGYKCCKTALVANLYNPKFKHESKKEKMCNNYIKRILSPSDLGTSLQIYRFSKVIPTAPFLCVNIILHETLFFTLSSFLQNVQFCNGYFFVHFSTNSLHGVCFWQSVPFHKPL